LAVFVVLATSFGFLMLAFAVVDPFLSKPLPYNNPKELVFIRVNHVVNVEAPTLGSWRDNTHLFKEVAAYDRPLPLRFRSGDRSYVVRLQPVTPNLLAVLGINVADVSAIDAAGTVESGLSVIFFERAFDRVFPGRSVDQSRRQSFPVFPHGTVRVIGVLPHQFAFPSPYSIFPVDAIVPSLDGRVVAVDSLQAIIARVDPAIPVSVLQAKLGETLGPSGRSSVTVTRFDDYLKQDLRTLAAGAAIAALLVFLVCITSVANILIARAHYLSDDMAIRHAIGASPFRVSATLFIELLLLVFVSGCAGVVLAHIGLSLMRPIMPDDYVRFGPPGITSRGFLMVVASGCLSLAASIIPIRVSRSTLVRRGLQGAVGVGRRSMQRLRFVVVVCQTASGTILLLCTILFVRSYVNLVTQETGFSRDPLIVTTSYSIGGPALQRDVSTTVARLRALAGVGAAGAAVGSMLDRMVFPSTLLLNGLRVRVEAKKVTPGYFEATGTTLFQGRLLTARDTKRSGVVVNAAFAKKATYTGTLVGARIGNRGESEIVGVVENELNRALDIPAEPTVYYLMEDAWEGCSDGVGCGQVSYVVSAKGAAKEDVKAAAIRTVESVNNEAVVLAAASAQERLRGTVRDRSFLAVWITLFSMTALIVMAGGLAGIVSFVVNQRSREVAIRIALGATPVRILSTVLAETGATALCGIIIGVLVGGWLSRGMEHLVFGISPNQLDSLAATAIVIIVVAAFAALRPARRALSVSPANCLRM
jgi:predicted permease